MKNLVWIALCGATWNAAALADDDKAACLDAASRGQTLRDAHQLVEARAQFRVCAREVCPAVVQRDCADWLAAVEKALPTVVVSAKDSAGNDVVSVRVSVDGKLLTTTLDGHAVPMNPGPHTFHFETDALAPIDRQVLVKEGESDQSVAVVLAPRVRVEPPITPVAPVAPIEPPLAKHDDARSWRIAGYTVGALGLVGLGIGAAFGFVAIADKNSANCDASGFCDSGPLADARTSATVSTVGVITGGVLLAAGVMFVLLAPRHHAPVAATWVAPRGGNLAFVW